MPQPCRASTAKEREMRTALVCAVASPSALVMRVISPAAKRYAIAPMAMLASVISPAGTSHANEPSPARFSA